MLGRCAVASGLTQAAVTEIPVSNFAAATGDGVVTIDAVAKTINIAFGTTATSARGSFPVTAGTRYRVSWSMANSNATSGLAGFGTATGGGQYRPTIGGVPGANFVDLTAISDPLWINFQRSAAGDTTFSQLTIQPIPDVTWTDAIAFDPASWQLSTNVTVDTGTGAITIPATGTAMSARQSITTESGRLYRLRWNNAQNTTQCLIGTSNGGSQMKTATVSDAVGDRTYEFRAQSATTWVQFQRSTSGTAVVSNMYVQQIN